MKKILMAFYMMGMALLMLTGCDGSVQKEGMSTGMESNGMLENGVGISSVISIEDAYYFDLLEDDTGELFACTDNASKGTKKDEPVIVWKSTDSGDTWEEMLYQPDELSDDALVLAGALGNGKEGIEVFAVFDVHADDTEEESVPRLYRITESGCEELNTDEVFGQIGTTICNISVVNDHVISLLGTEQCVFYDTNQQKTVKSLAVDGMTTGFLSMPEQFIVYNSEIVYCLDAETLEEQDAEKGLREFVADMYRKNDSSVFPPMDTSDGVVACITKGAIYEYRDGETVQVLSVPDMVNGGTCFNGMLPLCKGKGNTYYVGAFGVDKLNLQRIEEDKETEREVLTIYSLEKNTDISQIAMLFQQEHPELKVELQVGMEDEAALSRTDAIKQLNTELLAGEGPDLIVMDGLSVEKYADMGLLQQVDMEIPEDKYFKNIIETYKKGDALYAVPVGFWLYAVQGPAELSSVTSSSGNLSGWILSNEDKAGLDGYEYTYGYDVYTHYTQFVYDVYANEIVRDQTADRDVLEEYMDVCGKLKGTSEQRALGVNYLTYSILQGAVEIHYNGDKIKTSVGRVMSASDLAALTTEQEKEDVMYSFYPMYQPRDIIAVSANTEHDSLAQDFVEFSLGDSAQKACAGYLHPVVLKNFRSAAEGEGMEVDEDGLMVEIFLGYDADEESFYIYRPTDEEIGSLEQEIKEMNNVFTDDVIIRDIVMEALESYLSGTATLEDAVSSAGNRIDLYLGE